MKNTIGTRKPFALGWAAGAAAVIGAGLLATSATARAADYASTVSALGPVVYYRLCATNQMPTEQYMATNIGSLDTSFNGQFESVPNQGLPGALVGDPNTAIAVHGAQHVVVPYSAAYNPSSAFSIERTGSSRAAADGWPRSMHRAAITPRDGSFGRTTATGGAS